MSSRPLQLPAVWRWPGAFLTGLALDLSLPGWNQSWLAWIALTPLLAALWLPASVTTGPARSKWTRWLFQPGPFLLGYTAGATFFLLTFHWLVEVTGLGWVILCLYLALFPGAWAWLMARVFRPGSIESFLGSGFNLQLALVGAAAWTGLEWLRGIVFSWNGLGVALHSNLPLLQLSAYGGVGGLSFLLCFVNIIAIATVIRFALEIRAGRLRPHFDFTITMAMVVALFAFGFYSLRAAQPGLTRTPLRFAAVQPAIPAKRKIRSGHRGPRPPAARALHQHRHRDQPATPALARGRHADRTVLQPGGVRIRQGLRPARLVLLSARHARFRLRRRWPALRLQRRRDAAAQRR